jgi:hypothetical protein
MVFDENRFALVPGLLYVLAYISADVRNTPHGVALAAVSCSRWASRIAQKEAQPVVPHALPRAIS